VEKKEVLIHFDGWTDTYDYWADILSTDLFPAGHCAYIETMQIAKSYKFAVPKGKDQGEFTWEKYAEEERAGFVPFELFSPDQIQGMTRDFFPRSNYNLLTNRTWPCDTSDPKAKLRNPRASLQTIKQGFSSACLRFIQTKMNDKTTECTMSSPQRLYYRGLLILPNRFETCFFDLPNLSFNSSEVSTKQQ